MNIYVNMPVGEFYGWAICGKNLITELNKLSDKIRYVPDAIFDQTQKYEHTKELLKTITETPNGKEYCTLQCIDNENPMKWKGSKNVGYMFWEHDTLPDYLAEQLKAYDIVATGSNWNTDVVKKYGINAVTIHQGVDCEIFKPAEKKYFKDKFVVFSGGKLEHRKGQDLVAMAVGQLQRKYKDFFLIASWGNVFAKPEELDKEWKNIKDFLVPSQTMTVELADQYEMAKYMNESDIGLFPNRSEGGTNLVMMEYMACGKPVIANYTTGQKDVLDSDYAFLIEGQTDEEVIEKIIVNLEFAYYNRDKEMGGKAREAMKKFTWENTAKEFLKLYE